MNRRRPDFFCGSAFFLAVILGYLAMTAQFESLEHPFLIRLVEILLNNATILVDYVLQLHRQHCLPLMDALVTGVRRRRQEVPDLALGLPSSVT